LGKNLFVIGMGAVSAFGVITLQLILPFAFDFISSLALVGVGFVTKSMMEKDQKS
jgi:hypothetical protein